MNKEKFLEMLSAQLQVLDQKEKQDILDEYALHIDMKMSEGLSEEEAIRDFGEVKELVADILEAYHVNPEFCAPAKVRKKEWKTPDMGKVKEEGIEVCTKAGGFLKRKMKACKEKCGHAFKRCGRFFRNMGEKLKGTGSRKEKKEGKMRNENERHIMKDICYGCKEAVIWCVRFCWNIIWFFFAVIFGMFTAAALFSFGVLIILNAQGYPLTGVTIGSFGMILMSGALTVLSLSFRKKSRKCKRNRMSLVQSQEVQYD